MPKLEEDIQNRFFDVLIAQEKGFDKTAINVYQKLVYMRYEEVIKNSLPLFLKYISEDELETFIKAFMKDTPSTSFVWKIPGDFIKFARKNDIFKNKEYLYELMTYDWLEVKLIMKEYKDKSIRDFDFKKSYKLSKSSKIKYFQFDIIGNDYKTKRDNYVVMYYDFEQNQVMYREVNPLLFFILKNLNKKQSFEEVLKQICQDNEIDLEEAKTLLQEPFKELYLKRVFD